MRWHVVWAYIKAELWLEVGSASRFGTLLLFQSASAMLVNLALGGQANFVGPPLWAGLFWIVEIFGAFQLSDRIFGTEYGQLRRYYYQILRPVEAAFGKLIVQSAIQFLLLLLGYGLFYFLLKPAYALGLDILITLILASISISAGLLLAGAIAAATRNPGRYVVLLGIPVLFPTLLEANRALRLLLDGIAPGAFGISWGLAGMAGIGVGLSLLLYPHVWRD